MVWFMNINLTDDRTTTTVRSYDNRSSGAACSLCLRNGTCAGGAPIQPHANVLLCAKPAGRFRHCFKLLSSVREEEKRRRRWRRNNAGRSWWCAFPIGGAKAAIQQQELDSELVVGSLHPSASAGSRSNVVALRFLLRFPAFSNKKNKTRDKTDRSLGFPGVLASFQQPSCSGGFLGQSDTACAGLRLVLSAPPQNKPQLWSEKHARKHTGRARVRDECNSTPHCIATASTSAAAG